MVFLDRRQRASRHLEWKVRIFIVAAVLALVGIYLEERWLTGSAIVILFAGLGLRFVSDQGDRAEDPRDIEPMSRILGHVIFRTSDSEIAEVGVDFIVPRSTAWVDVLNIAEGVAHADRPDLSGYPMDDEDLKATWID